MEAILEDMKVFFTENSTMVLIAIVALVAIVGFTMFRRNGGSLNGLSSLGLGSNTQDSKSPNSTESLESQNNVCDMSGVCRPQEVDNSNNMSPEQEQQQMSIQQQQQQQQQMMQSNGESS